MVGKYQGSRAVNILRMKGSGAKLFYAMTDPQLEEALTQ
jgi:hypothetical protein